MANIAEIQNLVRCGAGSVMGTSIKGCRPFLKKVSTIWLTPAGFTFDNSRELDEEYLKEVQAEGNLIVLNGVRAFTDNSEDNVTETLEDGTQSLIRLGLYMFNVNFINGFYFNAALNSLSGFGNYDVIFIDSSGNVLGTQGAGETLKGFTVGMMQADRLTFSTDATTQREGLTFQLLEREEVDRSYVFIQREQLDHNPNRLPGINEIKLSYNTVPVDGATTISIKAVTRQDGKPFTGATYEDFLVTVNGATNNPSAGTETSDGVYELTVTALSTNDTVASQLYDNAENRNVVQMDVDSYKSNVATTTVV